jgi:hypothetical protein
VVSYLIATDDGQRTIDNGQCDRSSD